MVGGWAFWIAKTTVVVIDNQRSQEFSDCWVEVGHQKYRVGKIDANSRRSFPLTPISAFGESDVKLNFKNGLAKQNWEGGYIEPGYKVKIIIADTGIDFEYISTLEFVLGFQYK